MCVVWLVRLAAKVHHDCTRTREPFCSFIHSHFACVFRCGVIWPNCELAEGERDAEVVRWFYFIHPPFFGLSSFDYLLAPVRFLPSLARACFCCFVFASPRCGRILSYIISRLNVLLSSFSFFFTFPPFPCGSIFPTKIVFAVSCNRQEGY